MSQAAFDTALCLSSCGPVQTKQEEEEEDLNMLRPVDKTDHMQQGTMSLHSIISL